DGLLHHPYLDRIGMVVDADLQALCCLICQIALPPDHISGHIDNVHPGLQVDGEQYSQAISEMEIAMNLPHVIAGGRYQKAYKGLKVYDGLACDACTFVAKDEEPLHDYQEVIDRLRREMKEVTRVEQIPQEKLTDELILQRLNSPDPVKEGINNTPLHRHQETATLKEYIRPTAALLAMLIRMDKEEGYFIPLSACLKNAIQDLQRSLMGKEQII
ncbi:hypothetical protein M405DRAFT_711315, partial [Rhizopogon salebrosus TDB-379]